MRCSDRGGRRRGIPGGRHRIIEVIEGLAEGDTIIHPLKDASFLGDADQVLGVYNRSRWTNNTTADYPSNLGAELGDATSDTLAGAFAATPA